MLYLSEFSFPTSDGEFAYFTNPSSFKVKMTCYGGSYPFGILPKIGLSVLNFENITILYGENGCGKTTALNVIAEKLGLRRTAAYNRTAFFEDYTDLCGFRSEKPYENGEIITSDDVFAHMLSLRGENAEIDLTREELFGEYDDLKYSHFQFNSLNDYEELKKYNTAKRKSVTKSKYVSANLRENIRERSNGESAFRYFLDKITENGLYLLDEPENSLSPARQIELLGFLEDAAEYMSCQLVISTHSPFILSAKGAKIYDLSAKPATVKKWTEPEGMRTYYNFFKKHAAEFENLY